MQNIHYLSSEKPFKCKDLHPLFIYLLLFIPMIPGGYCEKTQQNNCENLQKKKT
jgi:hypothetical protein